MIQVGVIGCGKIAQVRHIPEYEANPDAKIVALYDVNVREPASSARPTAAAPTRPSRSSWPTPTSTR